MNFRKMMSIALFSLLFAGSAIAQSASTDKEVTVDKKLLTKVNKELLNSKGKKDKGTIGKVDYTMLYFSAHWCPPCRAFTPKLVEYVNKHKKGTNFDVILVSSDRDEKSMLGYMTGAKMPWNGLHDKDIKTELSKLFKIRGIPSLVILDKKGKVVYSSTKGGGYTPPAKIIAAFKTDVLDKASTKKKAKKK